MIDFLKVQMEYVKAYYNKVTRKGADRTTYAHYNQEDAKDDAYCMIDGFYCFRIPSMFSVIRTHSEDVNPPLIKRFFDQWADRPMIFALPVYEKPADTLRGCKRVRVFKGIRPEDQKKFGYDASVLDKFIKDNDGLGYCIEEKTGTMIIKLYDEPAMLILPIKPPSGTEW